VEIHDRIEGLMRQMQDCMPALPGSISRQYNVCGKPDCRCKHPDNPQRHGPYGQLSYSLGGRSSSMFVKSDDLEAAAELTERWKRLSALRKELGEACLELARRDGVAAVLEISTGDDGSSSSMPQTASAPPESAPPCSPSLPDIRRVTVNRDHWKAVALERTRTIAGLRARVRDLENSRARWKDKTSERQEQIHALRRQSIGLSRRGPRPQPSPADTQADRKKTLLAKLPGASAPS